MDKQKRFNEIIKDIKSIKIQGARNIAKAALFAFFLFPNKHTIQKLISLRPTEPMLHKVLSLVDKFSKEQILLHFDESQNKINKNVSKLIKSQDKIFTHCHSTNVINALVYAKKQGKKFEVLNTETRPLFQGRKTSKELSKAKIKVTIFVDSALDMAIEKENKKDKIYADKIFLGADALLKTGIINKIGSNTIAELAHLHKIPIYIIADSWKFSKNKIPIEQRKLNEVWDNAPEHIKIKNPAFEFVDKKYITKIITELGIMSYSEFVKRMK
jgi:ribose 1,5-bisphosphate isomerase